MFAFLHKLALNSLSSSPRPSVDVVLTSLLIYPSGCCRQCPIHAYHKPIIVIKRVQLTLNQTQLGGWLLVLTNIGTLCGCAIMLYSALPGRVITNALPQTAGFGQLTLHRIAAYAQPLHLHCT
jgi:hypothetical protein